MTPPAAGGHALLAGLALRRALFGVWPGAVAFALVLWLDGGEQLTGAWVDVGARVRVPTAQDVRRASDASIALVCLAPLLVLHAAATTRAWPRAQGVWLASRAVTRRGALVGWFAGVLAASVVLLAGTFLAVDLRSSSGACPRALGAVAHRAVILQGRGAELRLPLGDVPAGARTLRASFATTLGSDPEAGPRARVRVRAEGGPALTANGFGRFAVDVALDPGRTPTYLELATPSAGPGCALARDGLVALGPNVSSRSAVAAALLHAGLALGAALALALGAGACMGSAVAAGLTLCPWLLAWSRETPPTWWPGGDLWRVLTQLEEGLAPALPNAACWLVTALAVTGGLELARIALARADTAR